MVAQSSLSWARLERAWLSICVTYLYARLYRGIEPLPRKEYDMRKPMAVRKEELELFRLNLLASLLISIIVLGTCLAL